MGREIVTDLDAKNSRVLVDNVAKFDED